MKTLPIIKKEVLALNKTTQPIDPAILELLIGLRAFGISTLHSCAGQFRKELTVYQQEMQSFGAFLTDKYKKQIANS